MIILPIIAAGVSVAFSVALFMQYRSRKGLHQLAWGIAMAAFAVASLTVAAGIGGGWDPTLYRSFWLFGALLNVPWLAVGSLALVAKRPVALAAIGLAALGSAYALFSVIRDPIVSAAFVMDGIPSSSEAWGADAAQTTLVNFYSIVPYVIVVAIALWSSRTRKGVKPPTYRIRGNAMIAIGVTIVAVGGSALRRFDDSGAAFSVALALGVITMFVGFLLASRAPRYTVEDPGDQAT